MSCGGSHLGFPIGIKNRKFVEDLPMIIPGQWFQLSKWFQRRRLLNIFSIGSYVKTKSTHGGHLEFPIGKRFTSLVQDHPMLIPAVTIQLAWWFLTRGFLKFQPMRKHHGPWQPFWISNQHQKHKPGREPSNEHFW